MVDIGSLRGTGGTSHSVKPTVKPTKQMQTYEKAFNKIEDFQPSYKAFLEKTEQENPLAKRKIKVFKKGKYPLKKTIAGFAPNLPSNRVGG